MGSKAGPPPDGAGSGVDQDVDPGAEFRAAVGPVTPLRQPPRGESPPRRPPRSTGGEPRSSLRSQPPPVPAVLPVIGPGETVRLAQPGVPMRLLRRLDGERFVAEAELDLHGLTAVQAASALHAFIAECLRTGCERVRIIHGKGYRLGQGPPVLKALVIESLKGYPAVLAQRSAGPRDGASGALRVLLRRV